MPDEALSGAGGPVFAPFGATARQTSPKYVLAWFTETELAEGERSLRRRSAFALLPAPKRFGATRSRAESDERSSSLEA